MTEITGWTLNIFADGAKGRARLIDKAGFLGFIIETVRRSDQQSGFEVIHSSGGSWGGHSAARDVSNRVLGGTLEVYCT